MNKSSIKYMYFISILVFFVLFTTAYTGIPANTADSGSSAIIISEEEFHEFLAAIPEPGITGKTGNYPAVHGSKIMHIKLIK